MLISLKRHSILHSKVIHSFIFRSKKLPNVNVIPSFSPSLNLLSFNIIFSSFFFLSSHLQTRQSKDENPVAISREQCKFLRSNYTARTPLEFVRALSGLEMDGLSFLRHGERPAPRRRRALERELTYARTMIPVACM